MTSCVAVAGGPVLSPLGYGSIKFGAKLSEVEAALDEQATPINREPGCDFVRFKRYSGISFMVENGVVTRADATPGIFNSARVTVGTSLKQVKKMHPDIQIEPHHYDEVGHYLTLTMRDKKAALVFEESAGKVTDIRAGLLPSVQYVEGCL
jgi:hypothetical protein